MKVPNISVDVKEVPAANTWNNTKSRHKNIRSHPSEEKNSSSRLAQVDWDHLVFGAVPTDHMFTCTYKNGAWSEAETVTFAPLVISPLASCFHYGQTVFEGMKGFRMNSGNISLFRPWENYKRMKSSAERMCMPMVSEKTFFHGLDSLIVLDQKWVPDREDVSLYIRPFLIATEPKLGVKISEEYLFMIIASPSGKYFSNPLRLKVETEYVRAAEGGVGYAKCGGNYAASYFPAKKAKDEGFDQVIWTDSKNHEYIEESGVMNIMLVVDNELLTPSLTSTILDGITRDSILTLGREYGLKTVERKIRVEELQQWLSQGKVREAFGTGTAAVVSPIREMAIGKHAFSIPIEDGSFMMWAKSKLEGIRKGSIDDSYGWNYVIKI